MDIRHIVKRIEHTPCACDCSHSLSGAPGLFTQTNLNQVPITCTGDGIKRDPERENWPCRVMLPILPIQSISGSRLLSSPGILVPGARNEHPLANSLGSLFLDFFHLDRKFIVN